MAELDAVRIAAVFAADADFQIGPALAAAVDGDLHETADAFKVEVVAVNTMHVRGKERRRGKTHGFQSNWKKAVVTLAEGQKIESMFQGV